MTKETMKKRICEAKDVSVYKKLLMALSSWSNRFPMTGIDTLLDQVTDKGKSILPKDKHALAILDYIFSYPSYTEAVSMLLNTRFADLPEEIKPLAKIDRRCQLAFWNAGDRVSDMVKDLIKFGNETSGGFFCDMDGKKVTLLDTVDEEGPIGKD